jgi:putative Mg2+ transporter-C (MgtC) family protein
MTLDLAADSGYALRLVLAAVLGAAIGLEREIHDHPAGMRTHLLVSLGSAGFTVLSIGAFQAPGADPARVAAQVVTGVGFLGAGAILKEGATIRGLTTAASLWAVAAVGMAAGAGALLVALTITAIAILSLWPLRRVAARFIGRDPHRLQLALSVTDPRMLSHVVAVIAERGGTIAHMSTTGHTGRLDADLDVRAEDLAAGATITAAVAEIDGVQVEQTVAAGD